MRSIAHRRSRLALAALPWVAVISAALPEPSARACGGCFSPPTEHTVVTDHRMAFSLSPSQSVLWDQIEYSGNPSNFSWVLPVRSGTVVQLSHDEWFQTLDAVTAPVISGPRSNCNSGSSFACGGQSSAPTAAGFADLGPSVQVLSQSVVGPYDSVTLRSTDPNALEAWLAANGYSLPDSIRPTIAAYVAGHFDFIALRLQPGVGVQAMQPVRVVTPGVDVLLPLRMVAAGVGSQVGITLYVISEGRYEAASPFFNATIDESQLRWNATQNRSNYQELSRRLMATHDGYTWLTEFAGPASLVPSGNATCGLRNGPAGGSFYGGQSVADLYASQCPCPVGGTCATPLGGALPFVDASLDAAEASTTLDDAAADATQAADAAGDAFADDASSAAADASFGPEAASPDGGVPSAACRQSPCAAAGFDDLDVALVGLHPADVWVTRLRAILPVNALSKGDLHIEASNPQTQVSNLHNVNSYDDPNYDPCGGTKSGCHASPDNVNPLGNWLVIGTFGFVGAALLRRRRR